MTSAVRKQPDSRFNAADLHEIVKSTFVEQVEFHRVVDSTNDCALKIARESDVRGPVLVLAERQTEGRGRGTNQWWADQGALTFSLLVHTDALHLPPRSWPQASLTVGLAVCEAIEEFLGEAAIQLKWPNDVYVRQRKACGILIELPPENKNVFVIGIGINVNNSVRDAPQELLSSAIAMCDVAGHTFSLVEVLERVLVRIEDRLQWIGGHDEELRKMWRERCLLTNRTVHMDMGTRRLVGLCRGIDDEGALVIETEDGTQRCYAGVVTSF